ncbi:MAG: hypothetical protein PHH01_00695 [Patescibacteria group bacterium]|nr:hypothetical protein [Patescibacteria group bacterium]
MKLEIVEKIRRILSTSLPTEADVQYLFTLSRKLIEQLPSTQKSNFALLRFYCDWTLHSKIDQSAEGAMILEKLHSVIINNRYNQDLDQVIRELSAALSFDTAMNQINNLIQISEPSIISPVVNQRQWRPVVVHLLEIICRCPLKIDAARKGLKAVITRIMTTPIKGKSVVEQVAIIKVPKKVYGQMPAEEVIYCLELTTSDTTRIIAPLTLA